MRCPECNTEISGNRKYCPNCGAPVQRSGNSADGGDEPRLGRGMKVFIAAGFTILLVFGVTYYTIHSGDPGYVHTMIEPDTTLAEKNGPKFDTVVVDTAKRDSIKKAERQEAEKLLNSIRHKKQEEPEEAEESSPAEENGESQPSEDNATGTAAPQEFPSAPAPAAPKPKVEPIEE